MDGMRMNLWFAVALVFSVWSVLRARKAGTLSAYLLAAFWICFALRFLLGRPQFMLPAFVCLAGYWIVRYRERRRTLRLLKEMQESLGISDEDIKNWKKGHPERERLRKEKERIQIQKEAAGLAKKKRLAAEEKAYAARARPTFVPVTGTLSTPTTLAAEGGSLVVGPGPVQLEVRLKSALVSEENYDVSVCTRLVDNLGIVWEGESFMLVHSWLRRLDETEDGFNFTAWALAPDEWKKAIADECQVAGIQVLLDSRMGYELTIDGTRVPYFEKYQCPSVDIAWVAAQGLWLVRVVRLYRDPHGEKSDENDDEGFIPPFCWVVDAEMASLPLHPDLHGVQAADLLEETADGRRVVFRKTNRKAVAQAGVQFQAVG